MLNGVMADWKHDKIFYDAVCSASKLYGLNWLPL
jgi:hypothetical protein